MSVQALLVIRKKLNNKIKYILVMIFDSLDVKYLKNQLDKLSNLDLSLSNLRDSIVGSDNRSLTDIYNRLSNILDRLDTNLSSRASESTLQAVKAKIDKLSFDENNNLLVNVKGGSVSISNFPSWFTKSSKTTDDLFSKLDALDNALASVGNDKLRTSLVDSLPAGDNWIGRVKLGDGSNIVNIVKAKLGSGEYNALTVAPDLIKMLSGGANYIYTEITVSTTEDYSTFSPELKFAILSNRDPTYDIFVRFNDPNPDSPSVTKIRIPAGTAKVVMYPIKTLNYVASGGTPILVVMGFQ